MKKFLSLLFVLTIVLGLTACGKNQQEKPDENNKTEITENVDNEKPEINPDSTNEVETTVSSDEENSNKNNDNENKVNPESYNPENYNTSNQNAESFLMMQDGRGYHLEVQNNKKSIIENNLDGTGRVVITEKELSEKLKEISCEKCNTTLEKCKIHDVIGVVGEWIYLTIDCLSDQHIARINIINGNVELILCKVEQTSTDPKIDVICIRDNKLYFMYGRPLAGERVYVGENSYIEIYENTLKTLDLNTFEETEVCKIDKGLFQIENFARTRIWDNGSVWFYAEDTLNLEKFEVERALYQLTPDNQLIRYGFRINNTGNGDLYLELLGFAPDGDLIIAVSADIESAAKVYKIPVNELEILDNKITLNINDSSSAIKIKELDKYEFSKDNWEYGTSAYFGKCIGNKFIYSSVMDYGIYCYDFDTNTYSVLVDNVSTIGIPMFEDKIIYSGYDKEYNTVYYEFDFKNQTSIPADYLNYLNFDR